MILRSILFVFLLPHISFSQTILTNSHAHNDYWHTRPLLDALDNGFMSVEADCFLINGQMFVAHQRAETKNERTLQKLYLDPLMQLAKENSFKSIYKNGPPEFVLYIDIKADCKNFILFLDSVLQNYDAMLSKFSGGSKTAGAVRILVDHCGNDSVLLSSNPRYLSLCGNKGDANIARSNDIMPRISFAYNSLLRWKGLGKMPEAERVKLKAFVQHVHNNGYTIRMWAAGNNEKVWSELVSAGVDWINVDDLERFRAFMKRRQQ